MDIRKIITIGLVGTAMWANAAEPSVTGVRAQQRYPWNGKVDISYTVENAGEEARMLSVWAVDRATGVTNVAWNVTGDVAYASGRHNIVWDMAADGLALVSTNVVFGVLYKEQPKPEGLYCVIDLSGGTSAETYPVTYLDEVPSGGWSDEYKTTKLVLRRIPAGSFTMGSPEDEVERLGDETQHQVTLTKDFFAGVFEVTQRQWELVMGTRPSYFYNDDCYAPRPVECVSYDTIRGSSVGAGWPDSPAVDGTSFLGVLQTKSGLMLDLPTEAQWEYACRAGTTTALNSGKNLTSTKQDSEMDKVGRYGWYNSEYYIDEGCDASTATAKVGSYAPNAWGLYDMHGNVWEWCLDWYRWYPDDVTDPKGPSSGSGRVVRGGSWSDDANCCRSAYRNKDYSSCEYYNSGFRLAWTLPDAAAAGSAATGGASEPVRVDLSPGTRTAAATETLAYSTAWGDASEDAVAVVSVNGVVISEQPGSGMVEWTPARNGTYALTHAVMSGGSPVGETLTAKFSVGHSPGMAFAATNYAGTYDGTAHGITVTVSDPAEGAVVTFSRTADGEYTTESIPFTDVTDGAQSVYFKIAADGYLPTNGVAYVTVTPRPVTLTSGSATKQYDGTALTNPNIAISGSGWAEGEGATYDVTGSQTEIGSSANTFTYALNGNTKAANYQIEKVEGTLAVTSGPVITGVTAQQRYPWNGKVDISYTLENAGEEARMLSVWAADWATGITNVAKSVTGDVAYADGRHNIVWDMAADGLTLVSTNVVFGVSYVEPLYCVIDLSGGTAATSYPVTYLDEVPSGGWSDEYKTTKLVLRRIQAGSFAMGSPADELGHAYDETQHRVTLTKDYYAGVFEVTQRQWELVMGTRPSYFSNDVCYASRPVEKVNYGMIRGASAGANWPDSSDVDATSFLGVLRAKSGLMLDLPTEAQWEYACRAGTTTALNSGKNLTDTNQDPEVDKVGRYRFNGGFDGDDSPSCDCSAGTAKVGSYAPNAWGLYDMHGNAWEWCLDWKDAYPGDANDPKGPSSGSDRAIRGGGWYYFAGHCRSAFRLCDVPSRDVSVYTCNYGFRLVRNEAVAATGGASEPVRVDLTAGTRTAAATETLAYSTAWGDAGEDAVAVVSVNGVVISEQPGSGTVEWTPTDNGTYVLTHTVISGGSPVGETLTATFRVDRFPGPAGIGVRAQQRYPWNGKVDISYTLENTGEEARMLSVWAVDLATGITNVAKNVTGDIAYASGRHNIVWDMAADGLTLVSTNVVFGVLYKEQPKPEGLYCVIDLSGGTSAEIYPVTYLDEVPSGGWSDEYKTTKLVLRRIPAGSFTMGSPTDELGRSDDETQHQVTLTKDFFAGVFEVTQRQWELVMGTRPSYFYNDDCYASRPVECVSYDTIRGASAGAGWPDSPAVDGTSFLGVLQAKSGLMLDLPTEAQWEYACRAGTATALNSGKNLTTMYYEDAELDKVGRYYYDGGSGRSRTCDWSQGTAKVGSYEPNAWGLYDMHGNAWEWCLDWYGSYSGDATDPKGPSSGSCRMARGGYWGGSAYYCRSANRHGVEPWGKDYGVGFRLVWVLSGAPAAGPAATGGASEPVRVDLTAGMRTAAATETLAYSTAWGDAGEDAVAIVAVDGVVISEQPGSGTVEWTPTRNGTYTLTHTVMSGGVQIGESLTATFAVDGINLKPPVISPASGTTFKTSLAVSMTCASEGATVYYTTDGTEPTAASTRYAGEFLVYGRTTVKAIAVDEGGLPSETAVAEYALGTCEAPVIEPPNGTVFGHPGQQVAISHNGEEGVLRYTLDGSDPTADSPVYEGPFAIDDTTVVKARVFGVQYFDSSVVTATLTRAWPKTPTPVIAADAVFTGTKNKVVISCADAGATIHYTLDGREPTAASPVYEKPFCVGESCTLCAKAMQDGYLDSDEAVKFITREWCIGDTMGKPDHPFDTSMFNGFVRVTDKTAVLGESMRSGAVKDGETSVLSTVVIGPGTLSFKWKTSCEPIGENYVFDHAEFAVDGVVRCKSGGVREDWASVSQRIEGDGEHVVAWKYVKDAEWFYGEDCVWVSEYAWESDYTATRTTDVPVPYDWLEAKCTDVVDEFRSYEKVAREKALNGRLTVEQCYVAGLDPESATNDFVTAITMVDGVPTVTWDPDLGAARAYKVWGSENLRDWQCPTNALHRFFKVTVEMGE